MRAKILIGIRKTPHPHSAKRFSFSTREIHFTVKFYENPTCPTIDKEVVATGQCIHRWPEEELGEGGGGVGGMEEGESGSGDVDSGGGGQEQRGGVRKRSTHRSCHVINGV